MCKRFSGVLCALIVIVLIIVTSLAFMRKLFPVTYIEEIKSSCDKFDVDINLALALIKAESNFKKDAVSHAGAKGVMQITDETFAFCNSSLGVKDTDIFDPAENIRAGVWYLSYLIDKYGESTQNAVAAYNAGMGNVDKWLNNPDCSRDGKTLSDIPFPETRRYTKKINRYKAIYSILY